MAIGLVLFLAVHMGDGQSHDLFLSGLIGRHLPTEPSIAHDQDPVRHAEHFRQIRRSHENGPSLGDDRVDELVDLHAGAYVHPSGGFVQKQDLGLGGGPLAEDDLLLVAARQGSGRLVDARHADMQLVRHFFSLAR